MFGHAKNLYEMYRFGKSAVNSKVFEKSLNKAKKNYQQKRKKQEKRLKRTKAGRRQLKEMKARQKATKQLWDGATKMVQPLGKVLTSARKLANNLTKAELVKSVKKDMKKKVIQKQNCTLPVRTQVPKNSLPTFRETVDAFDAFRQKYRTREAATAALPTMERYKDTFVYNQVKEALKNGRYKDYIYTFEYIDENGMSGPLGSAREFSLFKNKNSNQLNINSNSNSSSQGTPKPNGGIGKAVISNGRITIEAAKANPSAFSGKTADEVAQMLRDQGYDLTVKASTRSRSGAIVIKISNTGKQRNITQFQVSPGGGRHGDSPYVKISTSDQGTIKIVDGKSENYISQGPEKNTTIIFTER